MAGLLELHRPASISHFLFYRSPLPARRLPFLFLLPVSFFLFPAQPICPISALSNDSLTVATLKENYGKFNYRHFKPFGSG